MSVALVDLLFVGIRTAVTFGAAHPNTKRAADDLAAAAEEVTPVALAFVLDGVFANQALVPLDAEGFQRARLVAEVLALAGQHEIELLPGVTSTQLLQVLEALAAAKHGEREPLDGLTLTCVRWRDIPEASYGLQAEEVTTETQAAVHISLALAQVEALAGDGAWPWMQAVGVVRRIQAAIRTNGPAATHAVETAKGEWTVCRRALSATRLAMSSLHAVSAEPAISKSVGHACLAATVCGYTPRGAIDLKAAAGKAIERILEHRKEHNEGLTPHGYRVLTVLHSMNDDPRALYVGALLQLAYESERLRTTAEVPLEKIDLLAALAHRDDVDATWRRVAVNTEGVVPPGSKVVLSDGRVGEAIGPGSSTDPWRPRVLVDGAIVVPDEKVSLR